MTERQPFRYLREPLFAIAAGCYALNCLWWKPITEDRASFVHCYLGDVLCMPVLIPIVLWLQRRSGLRQDDRPPTFVELTWHWALWSCCFEWAGPRLPLLAPGAVGDPCDALAYGAGGLLGASLWCRSPARATSIDRWALAAQVGLALLVAFGVLGAYRVGAALR